MLSPWRDYTMDETKRLLLVDDEEVIRSVLARALRALGHSVALAGGGAAALAMLQRERFEAILLDINMPNVNGLMVLEAVKKVAPDTPVIMVTGTGEEAEAKRSMQLGAADYVTKPVDISYLDMSIRANKAVRDR